MLKRALVLLGLGAAVVATAAPTPELYEPLFCDRPDLYRPTASGTAAAWQAVLFGPAPDAAAVRALAEDTAADSRVRALAYGRLRAKGEPVPRGILLGVVFEIQVEDGVDVLAVYADGRIRYLNHAGGAALFDALTPELARAWRSVMETASPAAAAARPWSRFGSALPGPGGARLAFLRSDGLHMHDGRFDELQHDATLGPMLLAGAQVLQRIAQVRR